jgi:hypothetical protein
MQRGDHGGTLSALRELHDPVIDLLAGMIR